MVVYQLEWYRQGLVFTNLSSHMLTHAETTRMNLSTLMDVQVLRYIIHMVGPADLLCLPEMFLGRGGEGENTINTIDEIQCYVLYVHNYTYAQTDYGQHIRNVQCFTYVCVMFRLIYVLYTLQQMKFVFVYKINSLCVLFRYSQ